MQPRRGKPRLPDSGFSLIDVMMGSTILVVGLMGLIQAVTIGSEMLATARRQTLAAAILDNEIDLLRMQDWSAISALPTAQTTLNKAWASTTTYRVGDRAIRLDVWYRCISAHSGVQPPNTTYWAVDTPPYANLMTASEVAEGATFTLKRTVSDIGTNLRQITYTVEWAVVPSGFSTSRTYSRSRTTYIGKYGLNLSNQRS